MLDEELEFTAGLTKETEKVMEKLKLDVKENTETDEYNAVFLCGNPHTGKTEFADKVCKKLDDDVKRHSWTPIKLRIPQLDRTIEGLHSNFDVVHGLRSQILQTLDIRLEKDEGIESNAVWQKKLADDLRGKRVFIFIDDVPSAEVLKALLPKKLKSVRVNLLATIRDKSVLSAMQDSSFHRSLVVMKPLNYNNAFKVLKKKLFPDATGNPAVEALVRSIIKTCKGYKKQIKIVREQLSKYHIRDEEFFTRLGEWILRNKPDFNQLNDYLACDEKYLHLTKINQEALLDICSFFSNWEWDETACIVGEDVLEKLKESELVRREISKVSVPQHVMTFCRSVSQAEGTRITNASDLHTALAGKKGDGTKKIKGIWLLENKIPFHMSSDQLDGMNDSLRVLALGDWTQVKCKCKTNFTELRYFQAGSVEGLPFEIEKLKQPRFLENASKDDMGITALQNLPPHLRIMKWKAQTFKFTEGIKISKSFNITELDISCCNEDKLPEDFRELKALQKLILRECRKLNSLPKSFGKLRYLKVLDLRGCVELSYLPSGFGWLTSLEKVNFSYCRELKDLPETFGSLSSVMEIDFSYCKKIEKLPKSFVKLATLRVLKMKACSHLSELPEGFESLELRELCLESCKRLKDLPGGLAQSNSTQKTVSLSWCLSLPELPKGFINFIKAVEHLILVDCISLKGLPDELPTELSRLKSLNLSGCRSLLCLPKRFHTLEHLEKLNLSGCDKLEESSIRRLRRLPSLKEVNLSNCRELKGSYLTWLSDIPSLTLVDIHGSPNLVDRWDQMVKEDGTFRYTVATGRPALGSHSSVHSLPLDSGSQKGLKKKKRTLDFFHDKWFFVDVNGRPFYPSTLEEGSTLAVIFYHDYQKEEFQALGKVLECLQTTSKCLQVIHVGKLVNAFARELTSRHCVYTSDNYEAQIFFEEEMSMVEAISPKMGYAVINHDAGDKALSFSAWASVTDYSFKAMKTSIRTMEYLRLKELAEKSQHSNTKTLKELLLTKGINFLLTKENQMEIDGLKKKVVFLLISWLHKFGEEKPTFEDVFAKDNELKKKKFEVVWIPIVIEGRDTKGAFLEAFQRISWPSIADPWSIDPTVMQLFRVHPSFNKLPMLIAVHSDGQLSLENLMAKERENVSDLSQEEKHKIRKKICEEIAESRRKETVKKGMDEEVTEKTGKEEKEETTERQFEEIEIIKEGRRGEKGKEVA